MKAGMSPVAAGIIGQGTSEGLFTAGLTKEQSRERFANLSDEKIAETTEYQNHYAELPESWSDEKKHEFARRKTEDDLSNAQAMLTGTTSFLMGAPANAAFGRLLSGNVGSKVLRTVADVTVLEGLQETGQEGTEQFIDNWFIQQYVDPTRNLWDGVVEAGATGAVAGLGTGVIMGAGGAPVGQSSPIDIKQKAANRYAQNIDKGLKGKIPNFGVDDAVLHYASVKEDAQKGDQPLGKKPTKRFLKTTEANIKKSLDRKISKLEKVKTPNNEQVKNLKKYKQYRQWIENGEIDKVTYAAAKSKVEKSANEAAEIHDTTPQEAIKAMPEKSRKELAKSLNVDSQQFEQILDELSGEKKEGVDQADKKGDTEKFAAAPIRYNDKVRGLIQEKYNAMMNRQEFFDKEGLAKEIANDFGTSLPVARDAVDRFLRDTKSNVSYSNRPSNLKVNKGGAGAVQGKGQPTTKRISKDAGASKSALPSIQYNEKVRKLVQDKYDETRKQQPNTAIDEGKIIRELADDFAISENDARKIYEDFLGDPQSNVSYWHRRSGEELDKSVGKTGAEKYRTEVMLQDFYETSSQLESDVEASGEYRAGFIATDSSRPSETGRADIGMVIYKGKDRVEKAGRRYIYPIRRKPGKVARMSQEVPISKVADNIFKKRENLGLSKDDQIKLRKALGTLVSAGKENRTYGELYYAIRGTLGESKANQVFRRLGIDYLAIDADAMKVLNPSLVEVVGETNAGKMLAAKEKFGIGGGFKVAPSARTKSLNSVVQSASKKIKARPSDGFVVVNNERALNDSTDPTGKIRKSISGLREGVNPEAVWSERSDGRDIVLIFRDYLDTSQTGGDIGVRAKELVFQEALHKGFASTFGESNKALRQLSKDIVRSRADEIINSGLVERYLGEEAQARVEKDGLSALTEQEKIDIAEEWLVHDYIPSVHGRGWMNRFGSMVRRWASDIPGMGFLMNSSDKRIFDMARQVRNATVKGKNDEGRYRLFLPMKRGRESAETMKLPSEMTAEDYNRSFMPAPIDTKAPRFAKSKKQGGKPDSRKVMPDAVAKRIEDAAGLQEEEHLSTINKTREQLALLWHEWTRYMPELDPKKYGNLIATARLQAEVPRVSKERALSHLRDTVGTLNKEEYTLFSDYMLLEDLVKDIDRGKYNNDQGEVENDRIPFVDSAEDAREILGKLRDMVDNSDRVKGAIERRNKYLADLQKELVKRGQLPGEAATDQRYIHHQVLQYAMISQKRGQGRKRAGKSQLPLESWQKARAGSSLPYNTDFIESEFEVISQLEARIRTYDFIEETLNKYGRQAEKGQDPPEGWVEWNPGSQSGGIGFWDRMAMKAAESSVDVSSRKEAKKVLSEHNWFVPEEVAEALTNMSEIESTTRIDWLIKRGQKLWKQHMLLNPFSVLKYNMNNMSGDTDIILAWQPETLKHIPRAAKILYLHAKQGKTRLPGPSRRLTADEQWWIDNASEQAVIDAGFSVQDIPDLKHVRALEKIKGDKHPSSQKNIGMRILHGYYDNAKGVTTFRENLLRLAAFMQVRDMRAKGKKTYGASSKVIIDDIDDPLVADAKVARDILGDYGGLSPGANYLRSHLIPFYSWMHLNAPRYVRLFKNAFHEAQQENIAGSNARLGAKAGAIGAKKIVMAEAKLLIYATGFSMFVQAWNNLFFPDEEDELRRKHNMDGLHVIIGKADEEGKIKTVRLEGALSDAMGLLGLGNPLKSMQDIRSGRKESGEFIRDMIEAPVNRVANGFNPFIKTPVELLTQKSFYPDVFSPSPITDKSEHALRMWKLEKPAKYLERIYSETPEPLEEGSLVKGFINDLGSLVYYEHDAPQQNYWNSRSMVWDYKEKVEGGDPGGFTPSEKSIALMNHKKALRKGDEYAARKHKQKYFELGGDEDGIASSIDSAHPLNNLKREDGQIREFLASLSEAERDTVEKGIEWYEKTYRDDPEGRYRAAKNIINAAENHPAEQNLKDAQKAIRETEETVEIVRGDPENSRVLKRQHKDGKEVFVYGTHVGKTYASRGSANNYARELRNKGLDVRVAPARQFMPDNSGYIIHREVDSGGYQKAVRKREREAEARKEEIYRTFFNDVKNRRYRDKLETSRAYKTKKGAIGAANRSTEEHKVRYSKRRGGWIIYNAPPPLDPIWELPPLK